MSEGEINNELLHRRSPIEEQSQISQKWNDTISKAVDTQRGFGPRKLTEQEIGRWRNLVRSDVTFQHHLRNCQTAEDFSTLPDLPKYQKHFSKEKWSLIVQCLMQQSLIDKLNTLITDRAETRTIEHEQTAANRKHGAETVNDNATDRRFSKSSSGGVIPLRSFTGNTGKDERLFTRDSYARVKEELSSAPSQQQSPPMKRQPQHRPTNSSGTTSSRGGENNMSTSEFTERAPTLHAEDIRFGGDDDRPTLQVLIGNVRDRPLPRNVVSTLTESQATYSNSTYENWGQDNPDEL